MHAFPGQGVRPTPGIRRVKAVRARSPKHADRHLKRQLKKGYEGQVAQLPSGSTVKRKPHHDAEYRVADVARGKRHGILTVKGAGTTFRVQSPANAARKKNIGKLATVRHDGAGRSGKPRGARFKAIRDYDMAARTAQVLELAASLR